MASAVEHRGTDERHEVGGEDGRNDLSNARSTDERTVRPDPDLVLQFLEVDDVRVDGDADRDDEPGHAGEREGEPDRRARGTR